MAKKTNLKSFLANSIFLSVVLVFSVQQAGAREVPFGDANTINDNFNGAFSVYAADIDGDGDMDVLGAAYVDDDITWWENNFAIPGDFEPDEDVDLVDYAILGLHWLNNDCGPCDCDRADLNCDGDVDFDDLKELTDNWLAGK